MTQQTAVEKDRKDLRASIAQVEVAQGRLPVVPPRPQLAAGRANLSTESSRRVLQGEIVDREEIVPERRVQPQRIIEAGKEQRKRESIASASRQNLQALREAVFKFPVKDINDETFAVNEKGGYSKMVLAVCEGWLVDLIESKEILVGFLPRELTPKKRQEILAVLQDIQASTEAKDQLLRPDSDGWDTQKSIFTALRALRIAYSVDEKMPADASKLAERLIEIAQADGDPYARLMLEQSVDGEEIDLSKLYDNLLGRATQGDERAKGLLEETKPAVKTTDFLGQQELLGENLACATQASDKFNQIKTYQVFRKSGILPERLERQLTTNTPAKPADSDISTHYLPLLRGQYPFFEQLAELEDRNNEEGKGNWGLAWFYAGSLRKVAEDHLTELNERRKRGGDLSEIESAKGQIKHTRAFIRALNNFSDSVQTALGSPLMRLDEDKIASPYDESPPHPFVTKDGDVMIPLKADLLRSVHPGSWAEVQYAHTLTTQGFTDYPTAEIARDAKVSPLTVELLNKLARKRTALEMSLGKRRLSADEALSATAFMANRFGLTLEQDGLQAALAEGTNKQEVTDLQRGLPVQVVFAAVDHLLAGHGVYDQFSDYGNRSKWAAWQAATAGCTLDELKQSLPLAQLGQYLELGGKATTTKQVPEELTGLGYTHFRTKPAARFGLADVPMILRMAQFHGYEMKRRRLREEEPTIIPNVEDIILDLEDRCPGQSGALRVLATMMQAIIINDRDACGDERLDPLSEIVFPAPHTHLSGAPGAGKTFLVSILADHYEKKYGLIVPIIKVDMSGYVPPGIEGPHFQSDAFSRLNYRTMKKFGFSWEESLHFLSQRKRAAIFGDEVDKKQEKGTGLRNELDHMDAAVMDNLLAVMGDASGESVTVHTYWPLDRFTTPQYQGDIEVNGIALIVGGAYAGLHQRKIRGRRLAAGVPRFKRAENYVPITGKNAPLVIKNEQLRDRIMYWGHVPEVTRDSLRQVAERDTRRRIRAEVKNYLDKQTTSPLGRTIGDVFIDMEGLEIIAEAAEYAGRQMRGLTNVVGPRIRDWIFARLSDHSIDYQIIDGVLHIGAKDVEEALGIRRE